MSNLKRKMGLELLIEDLEKRIATALVAAVILIGTMAYSVVAFAHEEGLPPGNSVQLSDPVTASEFMFNLETVAIGLIAPNWGVPPPGIDDHLVVSDQLGIVWNIKLEEGEVADCGFGVLNNCSVFLDLTDRTFFSGERGLLGVAFHPDYARNGKLYTYNSERAPDVDLLNIVDHHSVISEWQVVDAANPDTTVDLDSERVLLRLDQPQGNHNGGGLYFGRKGWDENLYISLGDGGNRDDQNRPSHIDPQGRDREALFGHPAIGNGQDFRTPLGSVLRIDPLGTDSANGQYGIPHDNPFVGVVGMLDEIYAYGFRNPFRISLDSKRGDVYLGDVGQNDIEEVDVVVSGGNYGWRLKEGSFFFDPDGLGETCEQDDPVVPENRRGCATTMDPGGLPYDLINPVAEYDTHTDGHSAIGGFVYRGKTKDLKAHVGRYIFGEFADWRDGPRDDFNHPRESNARLLIFQDIEVARNGITHTAIKEPGLLFNGFPIEDLDIPNLLTEEEAEEPEPPPGKVVSWDYTLFGFGQDAEGELYTMGRTQQKLPVGSLPWEDGSTGVIYRIEPAECDKSKKHGKCDKSKKRKK